MKKYIRRASDRFLLAFLRATRTNPLFFAYKNMGILTGVNEESNGELHLIKNVLPGYISAKPVFIDAGANVGNYSTLLASRFETATIFSFEPHPGTFRKLSENLKGYSNVKVIPLGLSDQKADLKIYNYKQENHGEHSSLYKEVLTDLHKEKDIEEISITVEKLDDFCKNNGIGEIDFIKIDTEGNEYNILKGAAQLLKERKIKVIQFEFNEMNIISRIFLKDFYDLLKDYKIYRLLPDSLLPMFTYDSLNEIFKFQNIVAIKSDL